MFIGINSLFFSVLLIFSLKNLGGIVLHFGTGEEKKTMKMISFINLEKGLCPKESERKKYLGNS